MLTLSNFVNNKMSEQFYTVSCVAEGPFEGNVPVNLVDRTTLEQVELPAFSTITRFFVSRQNDSNIGTSANVIIGDDVTTNRFVKTSDGLTTTLLNNSKIFQRTCTGSDMSTGASPLPVTLTSDQSIGSGGFNVDIEYYQYSTL